MPFQKTTMLNQEPQSQFQNPFQLWHPIHCLWFLPLPSLLKKKRSQRKGESRCDSISNKNKMRIRIPVIFINVDIEITPAKKKSKHEGDVDETPESARRTRLTNSKYVVCLSGFKENSIFNAKLRTKLIAACKKLPDVHVLGGTEGKDMYNSHITHMICPPDTKTLKTLAGVLSGAWIINNPDWVFDTNTMEFYLPSKKKFLTPLKSIKQNIEDCGTFLESITI